MKNIETTGKFQEYDNKSRPLLEARQNAASALEYGRNTLHTLKLQEDALNSIEDTIEGNEYILQKSMKVLRGMSWSGLFYNMMPFSSDPPPVSKDQKRLQKSQSVTQPDSSSLIMNTSTELQETVTKETLFSQRSHNSPTCTTHDSPTCTIDADLKELKISVEELHSIGVVMGQALQNQVETTRRIEIKSDNALENTLAVNLRAAQLTQRTRKSPSKFIGKFQFFCPLYNKYLSAEDTTLTLTSRATERSTFFDCFSKEEYIIGIQNCKTLKYLGCTFLGSIACSGDRFGKLEECHIDLEGIDTGVLFLARNWGGGGWLKISLSKDHATAKTTKMGEMEHMREQCDEILLNNSTSSVHDKTDMIILRPQKILSSAFQEHS